jgi:hypothetical protein
LVQTLPRVRLWKGGECRAPASAVRAAVAARGRVAGCAGKPGPRGRDTPPRAGCLRGGAPRPPPPAIIATVPWTVTVRDGSQVTHERFDDLDAALEAVEASGRDAETSLQPPKPVDLKVKRFDPSQQVAARIELSGPQRLVPSVRAGVDIHGDGSTEAYLGRVRRQVVEQRKGESAYKALRRALAKA